MPEYRFEFEPYDVPPDETSYGLRAYLDRMPDEKMAHYRREMTDEEVIAWDGNFTDEGTLFLVCCERDIEVVEFRQEVEQCIAYREKLTSEARR
jgi:hypothetical protein